MSKTLFAKRGRGDLAPPMWSTKTALSRTPASVASMMMLYTVLAEVTKRSRTLLVFLGELPTRERASFRLSNHVRDEDIENELQGS